MLLVYLGDVEEPRAQFAVSTSQQLRSIVRGRRLSVPLVDQANDAILVIEVHNNDGGDRLGRPNISVRVRNCLREH